MDCKDLAALMGAKPLAALTPAERAAVASHLAGCEACRGRWDPTLRSQELYEAVRPARDTSGLREAVLARIGGEGGTASDEGGDQPTPSKRQRLAGFELLGRLGRGGMGTVLKARQMSMDRVVALKILPKRLAANDSYVKRFIREARAAARLRHPNIVQAYDVGRAGGYYYFAMEYVEGETCEAILRRDGPFDQTRARAILEQTASALAAAHEAGIVHRDIKPSNLMVDRKSEVRVTDFGLAKRTEGDIQVTADGGTLGTPAYVSPEMAAGKGADARSDLYSLGATLFHLLAGRPPFQGTSYNEVLIKQVNETPPALAEAAPHVDRRLCGIVDRLLRKNPAARFASAQALLEELETLGELAPGGPSLPPKRDVREAPTLAESPARRMRREFDAAQRRPQRAAARRRAAIVAGSSAAGLLAVVLTVWVATRPGPKPPVQPPPPTGKVVFVDREHDAEAALRQAWKDAKDGKWQAALRALDGLKAKYADTAFYASNRVAMDELRAKANAALKPPGPRTDVAVAAPPLPPVPPGWVSMFDGKTLDGWGVVDTFPGGGKAGTAAVEGGCVALRSGQEFAAIVLRGEFPTCDYEIALEAQRTEGSGDLVGITFPAGASRCSFIVAGAENRLAGVQLVDGRPIGFAEGAARPFTCESGRWYAVRLRVTRDRLQGWIDEEQVLDFAPAGHRLSVFSAWRDLQPLGLTAAKGATRLRRIRYRQLAQAAGGDWVSLFDGNSLDGWRLGADGLFAQHGQPAVADGRILFPPAPGFTGIAWTGDAPNEDYELALEAMCLTARKDLCNVVFPIGDSHCILTVGGWGGKLVGLSMCDGKDANNNVTKRPMRFDADRWYAVRLRVTREKVEAWIDDKLVMDLPREGHKLTLPHGGYGCLRSLGVFASQNGHAAVRNIRLRSLKGEAIAAPPPPPEAWTELFDGEGLDGWQVLEGGGFRDHGKVHVRAGLLRMELGPGHRPQTGIAYTGPFPRDDYEVEVDAMRAGGNLDFGCLVFPLGDDHCTLIVGGHIHGNLLGFREVDRRDAWDDPKGHRWFDFKPNTWYRLRLRVERDTLTVWVDDKEQFAMPRAGHRFEPVASFATATPFGVCTHATASAIRSIRVRRLDGAPIGPAGKAPPAPPRPDREAARKAAIAAYAKASEKVWGLLARRDYDEAEKLVAGLAQRDEHQLAIEDVTADAEAVRMLEGFWSDVEKAVVARKGQKLAIGDEEGTVLAVRNGQVTLKIGDVPAFRPVLKLTAAQALTLAGPEADARASLVRGVLLLAEGNLPAARKALAAAGEGGHVAIYKARLARLARRP